MYVLTVTHGPDKGKRIQLDEGRKYTFGASESDSIALTDPKVLDGHCSILIQQGKPILENHTASAGTFVGDKKINRAGLRAGAVIRIGDTQLTLTPATGGSVKGAPAAASKEVEPDPLIGKIIGGYKLNEVVGAGGMGTVYKATQLSLHRDVALKVLRPRLAKDQSFVDLFVAEARHAAQLVDPNVVQVYDAGTEGDVCYFAMEFIGQGSVEELLNREKKITWEEAILMVLEAAHGLQYAEGKGIVHRDIKPDNLMINDDGRIKIADLGLAKRGEGKKDQGIIGTPHFIPPEQALGKEVDIRADIYSLGATFFRMVTGRTVFSGKTAKEIVLKHIKEPAPAASSIVSSIPVEVEAVLATMLAKDPAGRYENTQALIAALENICAHHGIKGSIIRKGIPKRVLIPVAVLAIAAVGVAIYFATRDTPVIIDPAAVQRAKDLEEKNRVAQALAADQDRKIRKAGSDSKLQGIQLDAANLLNINETYDIQDESAGRETAWRGVVAQYRKFANSELANEFGNDIPAKEAADQIEAKLSYLASVQNDLRAWIDDRFKEAEEVDGDQRKLLSKLRTEGHYGDALNLCKQLSRDKPSKSDPFHKVETAVWTSADRELTVSASSKKKITDVIAAARANMKKERPIVLQESQGKWDAVAQAAKTLTEQSQDDDVQAVIDAATGIEDRFAAQKGGTPKEIRDIVNAAQAVRLQWTKRLKDLQIKRLEDDRDTVRQTLRNQRTRDPGAIPNLVMECDISTAIDRWQQHLQRDDLQTEHYRKFANEQIEMLRWVEYLFWRFQADVKATIGNKKGPLTTLAFDMPRLGSPGKTYGDRFAKPPDDIYTFGFFKRVQGGTTRKFGAMPMDWVYHACFHHRGTLRWVERAPVLEFALGVFCMETMQYDLAVDHFGRLANNGVPGGMRYVITAKVMLARAQAEKAALTEYLDIVQVLAKKDVTAGVIKAAIKQMDTFHLRHEGTLFYLDVMRRGTPIRKDVGGRQVPDLPAAPPRPN